MIMRENWGVSSDCISKLGLQKSALPHGSAVQTAPWLHRFPVDGLNDHSAWAHACM